MRVLLSRPRGERGAVSLVVAFMMVVLCLCAAFVTDFGIAYMNKRQVQTAVDAAVLAAGKVYANQPGGCTALRDSTSLRAAADQAADDLRRANLPGTATASADAAFNVVLACTASGLTVDYAVSMDSPVGLGQLATHTDHVTVDRAAQVTIGMNVMTGGCSVCILGNVDAGNADLTVTGGDIWVNGTVTAGPDSEWDATTAITINGSVSGLRTQNTTPPWVPGPDIADPYASMVLPLPLGGLVNKPAGTSPCGGGPGIYGAADIPNGPCTMLPGAYVVTGLWAAKNNTVVTGTGVTLYVKKPGALDFKNGNVDNFRAPTSPPLAGWPSGFSIIYDRDNTNELGLQGNGNTNQIIGTVYAPSSTIAFNGNACFTTQNGPIVAGGMSANGTKGCVQLQNASNVGGTWTAGGEVMTK